MLCCHVSLIKWCIYTGSDWTGLLILLLCSTDSHHYYHQLWQVIVCIGNTELSYCTKQTCANIIPANRPGMAGTVPEEWLLSCWCPGKTPVLEFCVLGCYLLSLSRKQGWRDKISLCIYWRTPFKSNITPSRSSSCSIFTHDDVNFNARLC